MNRTTSQKSAIFGHRVYTEMMDRDLASIFRALAVAVRSLTARNMTSEQTADKFSVRTLDVDTLKLAFQLLVVNQF